MSSSIPSYDIFRNLPVIETKRLKLRKLSMRDAGDIFEYASLPEVAEHVMWDHHRNISDSLHFLRFVTKQYESDAPSPWGIVHKELGKIIGTIGFHIWSLPHGYAEVGYALSKEYWNNGYITEAFKEVITFGFGKMGLQRLEATCMLPNSASERVMVKCGLKFEGILRERLFAKGRFLDLKMYSILKSEWEKNRE